jgi:hypothetical protein
VKKLLIIALSVFMGAFLVTIIFAQPAAEEATKSEIRQYAGEVVTMETPGKDVILIVKGKDGEITFIATDADMKVPPEAGSKVMVTYADKGGKMFARSVAGVKSTKNVVKKETKTVEKTVAKAK